MADSRLLVAAATRPYPTEVENGDVWHVDWQSGGCRIAVIDGLGHGPQAAAAAASARDTLKAAPDAHPTEALRLCHEALRGSRGAAIGIATLAPDLGQLTFAGVGNVEARLVTSDQTIRLPSSRGIVGATLPTIRPIEARLESNWLLLIHSDGVSDRFVIDTPAETDLTEPQQLTDALLLQWGRVTDDATIVVACSSAAPH
jgi:serine phosphatase RsbU (regulator of sigma subunit)